MADILIIKSKMSLSHEQLQKIFNCLKAQKETGIILKLNLLMDNVNCLNLKGENYESI